MPTYLVEAYVPRAEADAAETAAALLTRGSRARHRWSLLLPEEEICLHVLEGPSVEVVHEATVRAELRCPRISQVVLISAQPLEIEGGRPCPVGRSPRLPSPIKEEP